MHNVHYSKAHRSIWKKTLWPLRWSLPVVYKTRKINVTVALQIRLEGKLKAANGNMRNLVRLPSWHSHPNICDTSVLSGRHIHSDGPENTLGSGEGSRLLE